MSSNLAHEVIFSRKSSIVSHLPLTFINIPVAQVNSLKHLGTQLDKKVNFKEHLSNIESKEIKLFALFRKLQNILPRLAFLTSYQPFNRPHLD